MTELCDEFCIEDHVLRRKLNDALEPRSRTLHEDIQIIKEQLKTAKKPSGLLNVKVFQIKDGTFDEDKLRRPPGARLVGIGQEPPAQRISQ